MSSIVPYWLKVITYFEHNRYFENGLTIPFLMGSISIIDPSDKLPTINMFIDELISSCTKLSILKCCKIHEYVIALLDHETAASPYQFHKIGNLVCTDGSLNHIVTEIELRKEITTLYSQIIGDGTYSKNEGEWTRYTPKDRKRLLEVCGE